MTEKKTQKTTKKVELVKSTTEKVQPTEQEKIKGKVKLFGEIDIDSSKALSNVEVAKFLMSNKDTFTSPGQTGRVLVALKYLDVTELDYNSMAAIVKKFWSIKDSKVEVKTTGKSLASLMNGIKHSKIDLYNKTSRSVSASRGGRTISDSDINAMFEGLS